MYRTQRHSWFSVFFCLFMLIAGCTARDHARTHDALQTGHTASLTVYAAASLTEAFGEIENAFEAERPGVDVVLNLGGSQQLAHQINLGAPADVFASADFPQMQDVIAEGRILQDAPQPFARNRLVAVLPQNNPAGLKGLTDLATPGLRIILASEAVPAGHYTRTFLENVSRSLDPAFQPSVLANVASYEHNVRAVLTKVALGEADAGIVYNSDLNVTSEVTPLSIPDTLNAEAVYPIAPVTDSEQLDLAQAFIDFVRAESGQAILARHGFISVIRG